MTDVKQDFADFLAGVTDIEERKRLVREVQMLAVNSAPPEAFEAPIRTAREYLAAEIEVPPILVGTETNVVVVRGGVNARIGRAGKGKTVGHMNQLIRWAAGLPWLDSWIDRNGDHYYAPMDGPLKTLVIENEGAGGLFHKQLGLMMHAGEPYLSNEARELALDNLHIWGDGGYAGIKLDDPEKLKWVASGIEKYEPDIVFIEPFRGLWDGEENSSTDMAKVIDALVGFAADYKCGVLVSHHERKSGAGDDGEDMSRARGSGALEGAVTIMDNWMSVKGGDYREQSQSKNRHSAFTPPVRVEWDGQTWWYKHVPDDDLCDVVLTALGETDEPMTISEMSEATGEKPNKLRPVCEDMVKDNRLKRLASSSNGRGSSGVRYRIPYNDAPGGRGGGLSV